MAKQIIWTSNVVTTDAAFRDWGKKLSDAMTAVGFLKTADTGQIDWDTVARPVGASNYVGYEIRAFSDALQSSNPVYARIEYGSGTYNGSVRITIGRASDGAGNLVGDTTESFAPQGPYSGSADSAVHPCCICGGDGHIEVAMFIDSTSFCWAFWISRVKDDTGANTDAGIDFGEVEATTVFQMFFPKMGIQYPFPALAGLPALSPTYGPFSYGGNLGIFPVCTGMGYVGNPNLSCLVWDGVSINSVGSVITVDVFGDPHNYMITMCGGAVNGLSGTKLAMRYE